MRLTTRDVRLFQQATLDLHAPRTVEALRAAAPGIFFRVIPAESFSFVEANFGGPDLQPQNFEVWSAPRPITRIRLQKLTRHFAAHPFTLESKRTGRWGPYRLSDFWTARELRSSALWRDVYQHIGIGRLIAIGQFRGSRGGSLNLARPLNRRDFSTRDLHLLGLLQPHFQLALDAAELWTARAASGGVERLEFGLTPREADVAIWLARGRTNPEIASILGMRPRTVEKHVENILCKLGVENRTAAASVITGAASLADGPPRARRGMAKLG